MQGEHSNQSSFFLNSDSRRYSSQQAHPSWTIGNGTAAISQDHVIEDMMSVSEKAHIQILDADAIEGITQRHVVAEDCLPVAVNIKLSP